MNFWDQAFAAVDGYKYGEQPNAFLAQQAGRLPAAAAVLVPGDGEGRNGVWLAAQGHRVLSVDMSPVGLQKSQSLAARHGVQLRTQVADLSDWSPPEAVFDGLVLTYVHLPPAIRQAAHRRLLQGLKPGGWCLLEAFHPRQLAHSSGGPKDPAMLYTLDMLRDDWNGALSQVLAWEGEVTLAEGPGHQGLAHVTRWVGQRVR